MNIVIINEQHKMTDEQLKQVAEYGEYEELKVPASGWTMLDMLEQQRSIEAQYPHIVIFVSPIPYLMARLCRRTDIHVFLFHNDHREKVEKDGKVFYKIPETGWELLSA